MNAWAIGLMSNQEKKNILDKHKHVYDGYRTMEPKIASEQPLYVQDFANDKGGVTVSNKNNVTAYKNMGINEQVQPMEEEKELCSECGGRMQEGECMECGYGGNMEEGECMECGSNYEMEEEMQQVKDLKNVEDLNTSDKFDYVESDMMEDDSLDALSMQDYTGQEGPHDEKDMAPDGMDDDSDDNRKMMKDEEFKETQQGNPYDNEQSAFNFVSDGPLQQYESMESAFKDDEDEDFPMPGEDEDVYHEKDLAPDELDLDIEKFNPEDKSWEEIKAYTNMWDEIDEDIKESVITQKNKIVEMFQRMRKF